MTSSMECHDASLWILSGDVLRISAVQSSTQLKPLLNGNGVQVFEGLEILYSKNHYVSVTISQAKRTPFWADPDLLVKGMLGCKTYDRSAPPGIKQYLSPQYAFGQIYLSYVDPSRLFSALWLLQFRIKFIF